MSPSAPALLLAPLPVLLAMVLLALRRSSLEAGLAGAGVAVLIALGNGVDVASLIDAGLRAGWIAWTAVSVILAGLVFDAVASPAAALGGERTVAADPARYRRIFTACMLIGPFAESATGFGVGAVVTAALLRLEGLPPIRVAVLSLLSQLLVPWGALAIGTQVTAALLDHDPHLLGAATALLSAPVYAGALILLRLQAAASGIRPRGRDRLTDPLLIALTILLLAGANLLIGPETAALAALGLPIAVDLLLRRRQSGRQNATITALAPYLVLTLVLLATRLIDPLAGLLRGPMIRPFADLPGWAPLHHPSLWLLATGFGVALHARRKGIIGAARTGFLRSLRPAAATFAFVLLAGLWAAGGAPALLAQAWAGMAGAAAPAIVPPLAGIAGFLTGSNVAVAAMIAPLIGALPGLDAAATTGPLPLGITAALLAAGGIATMISPMRLAMAAALAGAHPADEAAIRRAATPLPVAIALLLAAAAAAAGFAAAA